MTESVLGNLCSAFSQEICRRAAKLLSMRETFKFLIYAKQQAADSESQETQIHGATLHHFHTQVQVLPKQRP